jgi:7-cyano-7-deazaguanine reductase
VTYDYPELVALCPMTGILDTYRVIIDFILKDFIPELKSLKMYFLDYKDLPISHEHICSKIKKEFEKNIQPEKICVRLFTSVRGGIYTTIKLGDDSIASSIKQRKVFG